MDSLVNKYTPTSSQWENNLFVEEYYSSTDVKISLNNNDQTEIVYINYNVQEQLKPLYGYHSRTWDAVAVGNRIITGTFQQNIKNKNKNSSSLDIAKYTRGSSKNADTKSFVEAVSDYNDEEAKNKNTVEWIGANQNIFKKHEDSIYYDYATGLQKLGYSVSSDSALESIKDAIREYQISHFIPATGILDTTTKTAITNSMLLADKEQITIPAGSYLYCGPKNTYPSITKVPKDTSGVIIADSYENSWKQVKLDDTNGTTGYIQMEV